MQYRNALGASVGEDARVAYNAYVKYMNKTLVRKYLLELREQNPQFKDCTDDEILDKTGLRKDGMPTLAAVMSFSDFPQAAFPQLCVTAVVIPGYEMGDTWDGYRFMDNMHIDGTIADMADSAVAFVSRNMRTGVRFTEDAKRVDVPEYPREAVHEAVVNALLHRDYSFYTEGCPSGLRCIRTGLRYAAREAFMVLIHLPSMTRGSACAIRRLQLSRRQCMS